jgi:hypothetical protein
MGDSFSLGVFPCVMAVRVRFLFSCAFGAVVPPRIVVVVVVGPLSMVTCVSSCRFFPMILPLGREGCFASKDHLGHVEDVFIVESAPFGLLQVLSK